jgi:hypothetical protein
MFDMRFVRATAKFAFENVELKCLKETGALSVFIFPMKVAWLEEMLAGWFSAAEGVSLESPFNDKLFSLFYIALGEERILIEISCSSENRRNCFHIFIVIQKSLGKFNRKGILETHQNLKENL